MSGYGYVKRRDPPGAPIPGQESRVTVPPRDQERSTKFRIDLSDLTMEAILQAIAEAKDLHIIVSEADPDPYFVPEGGEKTLWLKVQPEAGP